MATAVRYADASGIRVRLTPAGTLVNTMNGGDLMYDIPGVNPVVASLDGTSYTWVKVHYFMYGNRTEEGEGWVAKENTTEVSRTAPTKSDVVVSNAYLKQYQRLINARYIYRFLSNNGWTSNAIYAILGNMEAESSINPGKHEDESNPEKGYGLVQWTPSTKLTNWLKSGQEKNDIDVQLSKILDEVATNSDQWSSAGHSPAMTFSEFTKSSKSFSVLAEYFLRCYERPKTITTQTITGRQLNANKWSILIGYLL